MAISVDQLVDVIVGNRMYKPCCYFYNKIDTITIEEVDQLARMPHTLVGSVVKKYNIAEPLEDDPLKVCTITKEYSVDHFQWSKEVVWHHCILTPSSTSHLFKGYDLGIFGLNKDLYKEEGSATRLGWTCRTVFYSKGDDSYGFVSECFDSNATWLQFWYACLVMTLCFLWDLRTDHYFSDTNELIITVIQLWCGVNLRNTLPRGVGWIIPWLMR